MVNPFTFQRTELYGLLLAAPKSYIINPISEEYYLIL